MLGILTVVMLVGSLMVAIGVHHTKVYVKKIIAIIFRKMRFILRPKKLQFLVAQKLRVV